MEDSRQELQELILLKAKLETALDDDDTEEVKRIYDEFRNLYKKITGKNFEDGLSDDRLTQIESVINGTVRTGKRFDDTEESIEF